MDIREKRCLKNHKTLSCYFLQLTKCNATNTEYDFEINVDTTSGKVRLTSSKREEEPMNEDESCQWQTHISTIHRVPSNSSQCNFELFFDGELVPENLKPTFDNKDMDEKKND